MTGEISSWPPTLVLVARFGAYVWQILARIHIIFAGSTSTGSVF
jgi:hypothetical protein